MSKPDAPIMPLVADLMTASMTQTQQMTDRVIDGLTKRAETAEARLRAVVYGVNALLSGPYMPTPDAIRDALYPPDDVVAVFRKAGV